MMPVRSRLAWFWAGTLLFCPAGKAFAQASLWNGYQGSSSVSLNFIPSGTADPHLHYLGVSLSSGAPLSSISLAQGNEWTVDTGSTGVVITSDYLYSNYGIKASSLSQTNTASITYTSSGLTYSGFYATLNIGLYSATSGSAGVLAATAAVPVIVATTVSSGGQSFNFCTNGTQCTPNSASLEQFGIGFGRNTGSSDVNPLLNLTSVSSGDLQTMAPGYVVSRQGIQLGLTAADLEQTSFSGLLPSASTTPTSLSGAYARAATATDWQTPPATITIQNAKNTAANGTFYGSLLVDTGIANMELSTGGTYWNPTYDATAPSNSTSIAVYLPGTASAASGQPASYSLIYQGTCAAGLSNCPPYNAASSGLSPVYPVNSTNAPESGIAFVTSTATTTAYPFINTGTEFLNYFNIVYDPVSGFFGYQVAADASQTANDPTLNESIALQGATTIPGGTTVSLPTFLFAEFVQGYQGAYGAQTVVQLSSPGTVTMAGPISSAIVCGTGGLNCAATALEVAGGRFLFTADNTYLGATTVDTGATLALKGAGSIAASASLMVNGTFDISGASASATITRLTGMGTVDLGAQNLTVSSALGSFGGVITDGGLSGGAGGALTIAAGSQTLTGANTYTGATTIAPGARLLLAGTGSIASSARVSANGTLDISGISGGSATIASLAGSGAVNLGSQTLILNHAQDSFMGTIAGTGGVAVTGGAETLTGPNTYSGGTLVTGGATLAVNADSALGAQDGPLILNHGRLMALGTLASSRAVMTGDGGGTIDANGYEVSLNGLVAGSGTVTLSNGTTSINGLLLASNLVVSNGATLHGIGTIAAPTTVQGTLAPGNSPGTVTFTAPVTLAPNATTAIDIDGTGTATGAGNYSRVILAGSGNSFTAAGTLTPVLRGMTGAATNSFTPSLGQSFEVVQAAGGVVGSYGSLTQPTNALPAGTRFDALYGSNALDLVVTPGAYGDLAAAGLAETPSEAAVGAAVDAIRPAAGLRVTPAQASLFDTLYQLPTGMIAPALNELSPSIYADALVTTRSAWYMAAHAVDEQLAARRGLTQDSAANTAAGPHGSTIWMSALAGYNSTNSAGDLSGFTSGLGGAAAGIDAPVGQSGRIGVAVGTVDGQTWAQGGGEATGTTAQLLAYGQWQSGPFFAAIQCGGLYQQENVTRSQPIFGTATRGNTNGTAGGGGLRVGMQARSGPWLLEPSLDFGGFRFQQATFTESGGGSLAQTIGGQSMASAQSVLGASLQRIMPFSPNVSVVAKGSLGWAHEFASTTGDIWASFSPSGAGSYGVESAPIGKDSALLGLMADIKVKSWPVALFASYGGAINGSSAAQSLSGGVRFVW